MIAVPEFEARKILRSHWNGVLPVDPGEIARELGLTLVARGGDYPYSGYFRSADKVIEFNGDEPLVRRRFTVAHELGHFALGHLDSPRDGPMQFNTSVADMHERHANRFAAELLMPSDAVRRVALSGKLESVDQLASAFQVSRVAMAIKLNSLRISL